MQQDKLIQQQRQQQQLRQQEVARQAAMNVEQLAAKNKQSETFAAIHAQQAQSRQSSIKKKPTQNGEYLIQGRITVIDYCYTTRKVLIWANCQVSIPRAV